MTATCIVASLGAKVLLIDKERLGGDCLYAGCVLSKSLLHVARIVKQTKDSVHLGLLPTRVDVDMANVAVYI
ncbi:MAG: hypothetical protein NVS4B11_14780 [Ktedonobacteraceae bacterium]